MAIRFFSDGIDFKLTKPNLTKKWIINALTREGKKLDDLTYIFCSDEYLYDINKRYLNHKTYTDIITFDLGESNETILGEIYISKERVESNAKTLKVPFDEELHRVIIHGALHLCGYKDKTTAQKNEMRKRETAYLSLRNNS